MRDISSNFFSQFFVNINIGIGGYFEIRNIITGDKVTDLVVANFRLSWNWLGSDYNKGGHISFWKNRGIILILSLNFS